MPSEPDGTGQNEFRSAIMVRGCRWLLSYDLRVTGVLTKQPFAMSQQMVTMGGKQTLRYQQFFSFQYIAKACFEPL